MSMLLDAVQRQRHSEANQDPALAAMLPRQPKSRQWPWPWLLPPLALLLGAAAGWGWQQWQHSQALAQQEEAPSVPAYATLAARVSMPLPVQPRSDQLQLQPSPSAGTALEYVAASDTMRPTPAAMQAAPASSATPASNSSPLNHSTTATAVAEPSNANADPQLLAALEQAVAEVGGVTPEPSQPAPLAAVTEPLAESASPATAQAEAEPAVRASTTEAVADPAATDLAAIVARLEQQLAEPTTATTNTIPAPVEPQGKHDAAEQVLSAKQQQALQQALADAGMDSPAAIAATTPPLQPKAIPKLGQMPWSFQKRLPDLDVTAHVYASEANKSWLRANGRELQEGDEAAPGLRIKRILPNEIVLEMDNQAFRIPALGSL
ncbi:general secretion pathway protein GspB [uncultured Ferrimonas sp.]|uniref:general secretion pathway protein GspB n=1 Tax=uncultured Ferrimonas sp. TaxID=432640 RepID=UPI00260255E2|nr:general secretion pathway protein GspB [uncultured Ferrimonas sp.]